MVFTKKARKALLRNLNRLGATSVEGAYRPGRVLDALRQKKWAALAREAARLLEASGLAIDAIDEWAEDYWGDDDDFWGKVEKCYVSSELWHECIPLMKHWDGSYSIDYHFNGDPDCGRNWALAYYPSATAEDHGGWAAGGNMPRHLLHLYASEMILREAESWLVRGDDPSEQRFNLVIEETGEVLESEWSREYNDVMMEFRWYVTEYVSDQKELAAGQVGGR